MFASMEFQKPTFCHVKTVLSNEKREQIGLRAIRIMDSWKCAVCGERVSKADGMILIQEEAHYRIHKICFEKYSNPNN